MTLKHRKFKKQRKLHKVRIASRRQRKYREKYRKGLFSDVMDGKY